MGRSHRIGFTGQGVILRLGCVVRIVGYARQKVHMVLGASLTQLARGFIWTYLLKSGEFCGLGFAGVKAEAGLELGKF